ncbi:contractile injection system protein, VgrG/Pvc8 family [Cystobacter fuscus]
MAKVQGHQGEARTEDAVTGCELEQQVVLGRYALGDYFFETPSTRLQAQVKGKQGRQEQYEYPGTFTRRDVGEQRGRVRLEAHEAQARTLRGQGHVRWFIPGYRFSLAEHEREDINGAYVLRWVSHSATVEAYSNSFEPSPPPRPSVRPG